MATVQKLNNTGHVVLITSPFFGHMIPLLDFAKRLSVYYHVTYVVSASKLDVLKQRGFLIEHESNRFVSNQFGIDFIGIFDHNDDDHEVSTSNVTIDVKPVVDRMREPLLQLLLPGSGTSSSAPFLSTRPIDRHIDLIVADMFVHMAIRNAYERNIIAHVFVPGSFAVISLIIRMSMGEMQTSLKSDFATTLLEAFSLAKGFICNSFDKLDERSVDDLRQRSLPCSNMPIRFVASLTSEEFDKKQNEDIIARLKHWLDAQWKFANKSSSVIYVAFGTHISFTPEQLVEIADALAPYPTIWSLKASLQTYLPSSFIDDPNHLILDWGPQRFILSHPVIRLFLSHGGWNSLLECISAGKPILVWPLVNDQMANGYRVEKEFGIGQCMQNTNFVDHKRNISSDEITRYLKQMFDQESEYVQKAQQIKQMFIHAKENSSRMYFEEIIEIIDDQVVARTKNTTNFNEILIK